MANRAVVTGAAGFVGSHLVDRLLGDGYDVIGIDDGRTGDWSRVDSRCSLIERDLATFTVVEFEELLGGSPVLFHLAAEKYNSSKATPERVIEVNVTTTQRLFDAAGRAGVERAVFTSSLYAYGSLGPSEMSESDVPAPTTVYGASKVMGEHLLRCAQRDHGLSWAVARLFFVYGTKQFAEGGYKSVIVKNFERLAAGEAPTINGDGEQSLDYVYVDDVVDGLLALARPAAQGFIVNLGSGRGVSVNDLTALMLQVSGSDLAPITAPADWTAGSRRVGAIDRARIELEWTPQVDLVDGLTRIWTWMQENR